MRNGFWNPNINKCGESRPDPCSDWPKADLENGSRKRYPRGKFHQAAMLWFSSYCVTEGGAAVKVQGWGQAVIVRSYGGCTYGGCPISDRQASVYFICV